MSPFPQGLDAKPGQGWLYDCILQEWLCSPLQIARLSSGASGFAYIHVNRSLLFVLIVLAMGPLVSQRAANHTAGA